MATNCGPIGPFLAVSFVALDSLALLQFSLIYWYPLAVPARRGSSGHAVAEVTVTNVYHVCITATVTSPKRESQVFYLEKSLPNVL